MKKRLLLGLCVAFTAFALVGCGTKKIDITEYIDFRAEGYDGYGEAVVELDCEGLIEDNYKAFGLDKDDDSSDSSFQKRMNKVNDAVEFDVSPEDGLKNGDEVEITVEIDDEDLIEDYKVTLICEDLTEKVKGLEELEEFDPFKDVTVTFSGISPSGTASLDRDYNYDNPTGSLSYQFDKSDGLKNGDTITLSINYGGSDPTKYCAESYKMIPTSLTKEYTVEGLSSYVTAIDEIPDELMTSMQGKVEKVIEANAAKEWNENWKIKDKKYIGSYFLKLSNFENYGDKTRLILVYSITAELNYKDKDTNVSDTVTFYYPIYYKDIMVLDDGTGSVNLDEYSACYNSFSKEYEEIGWWGTNYYFKGYEDLESLFNDFVTKNIDSYDYESTVDASLVSDDKAASDDEEADEEVDEEADEEAED